jgi:hypothetical protein
MARSGQAGQAGAAADQKNDSASWSILLTLKPIQSLKIGKTQCRRGESQKNL